MVLGVIQFAHQPVDVRRRVAPDVGDEERDELRRNVVEHRAVHVDLGQDLPWRRGPQSVNQHDGCVSPSKDPSVSQTFVHSCAMVRKGSLSAYIVKQIFALF